MKTTSENAMDVLKDLIRINNDRAEGYQKAAKETKTEDQDLRELFNIMSGESRRYAGELAAEMGQEPGDETTFQGKIYRVWMDVKATFSGKDRKSVLAACEFGEDAAQKAYELALAEDLPPSTRDLIADQKGSLRKSHDKIKKLRDLQHA